MKVSKIPWYTTVSTEELIDAGYPAPRCCVAPTRPKLKRRYRIASAVRFYWRHARRGVGFWIAGETPEEWR